MIKKSITAFLLLSIILLIGCMIPDYELDYYDFNEEEYWAELINSIDWSLIDYEEYAEYLEINLEEYIVQEWNFDIHYTKYGQGTINPDGRRPFKIAEVLFMQAIPDEGWRFEGWYLYIESLEEKISHAQETIHYITSHEGINKIINEEYDYVYFAEDITELLETLNQIELNLEEDYDVIYLISYFTKEEQVTNPSEAEKCYTFADCGEGYLCENNNCKKITIKENIEYKVNATKTGKGEIQIKIQENNLGEGIHKIKEGTILKLNATPDATWEFSAWYIYETENEEPTMIDQSPYFEIQILTNLILEAEFIEQGTNPIRRRSRKGTLIEEENETNSTGIGRIYFVYPDWMRPGVSIQQNTLTPTTEPAPTPQEPAPTPTTEPKTEEVITIEKESEKSFIGQNLIIIITIITIIGGLTLFFYYKMR
jgi:hypothetical protein